MNKVLVTGGAGYIGSHTVLALNEAGYETVVYDNLSTGFEKSVLAPARFVRGDLEDTDKLKDLLARENISSIIHFAAHISVPESVEKPLDYYCNNSVNTIKLIRAALDYKVQEFIFSSTAAVYGIPDYTPVPETAPLQPINPYGRSKLLSEMTLQDAGYAHPDFNYVILRYFNVAGADPEGRLGQSTPGATHLIKTASKCALGKQKQLSVFGTDFPTFDGSGVRDYIHVTDLADAHVQSLQYLKQGNKSDVFNCGYGRGYSVRQIIDVVKQISGSDFPVLETGRRQGDPGELICDPGKIKRVLGWQPKLDDIGKIAASAYEWEKSID